MKFFPGLQVMGINVQNGLELTITHGIKKFSFFSGWTV